MPAHFLRESGVKMGDTFTHFSDAAQRLGVYTTLDYIEIMEGLIKDWKIESITNISERAEKARDYVVKLPSRLKRLAERSKIPELEYEFAWINR
jgi:acyl-[acyl-carrier-protein] desaturase